VSRRFNAASGEVVALAAADRETADLAAFQSGSDKTIQIVTGRKALSHKGFDLLNLKIVGGSSCAGGAAFGFGILGSVMRLRWCG
jgi:hypothetical protein